MKRNKSKKYFFKGSSILITGGSGSWGNELTRQLLRDHDPAQIRIYSRGEHKQVEMRRKFKDDRLKFIIGDVRDKNRLIMAMKDVDYVFHLAALKHVPVCEENPWEAVQTNIIGTQNVIEAALYNKVKKVIDVSTDKAVDPFNLYGVSKSCGEKLVIAANLNDGGTKFVCVRGGNVLGTNGSVIPLFKEQIRRNNEVTITDDRMTRFLMRVEEAIDLLLHAAINSYAGEIFVLKMPACKITDLVDVMIKKLGNKKTGIKNIGIRPGEKLYEVLVSRYEMPRTFEIEKYFVILPQIHLSETENHYKSKKLLSFEHDEFNSNNTYMLNNKEIDKLLKKDNWFDGDKLEDFELYLKTLNKTALKNFFKDEGWLKEK